MNPAIPLNMPVVRPVPIKTRGLLKHKAIWTWLTSRRQWEVMEDFVFKFEGVTYKIPKGFIFDGASIPRIFWMIYSPTGILFIPSIFHDYGYKNASYNTKLLGVTEFIERWHSKDYIDGLFYSMSYKINGFTTVNKIPYLAVRWFGRSTWKKYRKEN